ncbi:MAG: MerC domain-containing protein [Lentisphaeria bacterium]|nr:MerC domain-containing protein [Lentisphaeria bacterium]
MKIQQLYYEPHKLLDIFAVSMSLLCAIHCLITPILVGLLPLLATTIWIHQEFHLWMLSLVVPTTALSVFMGCRKHKDRYVAALGILGLLALISIALYEVFNAAGDTHICPSCAGQQSIEFGPVLWVNLIGGVLLASSHIRNFLLCRKSKCTPDTCSGKH